MAGDGLLNCAFEAISKDMMLFYDSPEKIRKRVNAAYEIAKGAGVRGMVAGQVSDIEAENAIASKEMLEYIHLNKTGALIRAAIKSRSVFRQSYRLNDKRSGKIFREPRNSLSDSR